MRLAQENFDAQLQGKDMEMRAAYDKQRLDMKRVLREHKDEMEKYRKEQEQKDQEFRTTNRDIVKTNSQQMDAKTKEHHQKYVELEDTIKSFDGLVKGEYDHMPEAAFYMVGGIEEAIEKSKKLEAEAA